MSTIYRSAAVSTLLFIVISAVPGRAEADFESYPMRFEHLTLEHGLSQSNVLSIHQDREGRMWFGTENGLNSYDGYEFDHYRRVRGNPDALTNDFIFDIDEDRDGNLWLATNGGGLAMLDRASGKVTSYRHDPTNPSSISSNVVRRVLVATDGTIWAGTRNGGLNRLDPETGRFTIADIGMAAGGGTVFALLEDGSDVLWVGGDHGLSRLERESGHVRHFTHDPAVGSSIPDASVRAVVRDSDGLLWIGSFGGGLSRLDEASAKFVHFVHDANDASTLSDNRVSSIFEDDAGRLWVGTTAGLNLVDRQTGNVARYSKNDADPSSLGDNDITTIFQDRGGLMWFGTKWHGVDKWNPRSWSFGFEPVKEITTAGKNEPNVTSIVDDGNGTLWIGTFGDGLNAIDRETGEITKYRNSEDSARQINDDRVMSLMLDTDGRIWAGTMSSGITRIDATNGEQVVFQHDVNDQSSLSANGVMAMFEDSAGYVWVGTFGGGISRLDPATESFTRFRHDPENPRSLSSNRVTSFAEDPSGRMWVGTDAGGLNLFDPANGDFHRFRHDPENPQTLAADTIYSLAVDASGTVWVGTRGGGLDRVVGSADKPGAIRFDNTSQADGLANDVVYGVQADELGRVWASTNFGISRYNPETGEIKNMHRKDGLQSEEFNFGAHFKSASGELFFGGHNGFNAFHPDDIRPSKVVPLIALTGFFKTGDRTRSDVPDELSDGIEISWKDDVVAFEFSAMDFTAPAQNRYMYKLEGFDNDWIDLGNRRRATYTDLDDGNYLLRVKAANSEGVWNEAGFTLPISVTAAPWDTWWAYLGYAALCIHLGLALLLGHRRKIRREEEYSHRLEREVNSRTEKLLDKNQQLRDLNKALQESSLSDPLTGLRNRRFVFEEVSRDLDVIRRRLRDERDGTDTSDASELVFMMVDLDNFKPINDTYGHAAGDRMLIELRDVLLGICRRSDFVIRWGGDEFVIIAKQTRPEEAEALAERIRSSVAGRNFTLSDGQIVRTTCSIGFAAYPLFKAQADESSLDQIISLADGLMYEAKKQRNAWVGMLGPSDATTSFDFDHDTVESTSMLFRARRAGKLNHYIPTDDATECPVRRKNAV